MLFRSIGANPFTEQYVLAALIQQRLGAAGLSSTAREGLGSAVIFNALRAGEIDVYVDYSGTIWTNQMRRAGIKPRAEVLADMAEWLVREHRIKPLGSLGFENAYALAMPRSRAETLGIRGLADLSGRAQNLTIAGDYEFFARPEWERIRATYGIAFREQRQMQAEFMYAAAARGEVDVVAAYTSEGLIAKLGLVVLDDPKQAVPPYDAVILLSPRAAKDDALLAALHPLIDAIDVESMRAANLRASSGDVSPTEAATWLEGELRKKRAAIRR